MPRGIRRWSYNLLEKYNERISRALGAAVSSVIRYRSPSGVLALTLGGLSVASMYESNWESALFLGASALLWLRGALPWERILAPNSVLGLASRRVGQEVSVPLSEVSGQLRADRGEVACREANRGPASRSTTPWPVEVTTDYGRLQVSSSGYRATVLLTDLSGTRTVLLVESRVVEDRLVLQRRQPLSGIVMSLGVLFVSTCFIGLAGYAAYPSEYALWVWVAAILLSSRRGLSPSRRLNVLRQIADAMRDERSEQPQVRIAPSESEITEEDLAFEGLDEAALKRAARLPVDA